MANINSAAILGFLQVLQPDLRDIENDLKLTIINGCEDDRNSCHLVGVGMQGEALCTKCRGRVTVSKDGGVIRLEKAF